MTEILATPLVTRNTLLTPSPEEGLALAIMLARHSVHAMQHELEGCRMAARNMRMTLSVRLLRATSLRPSSLSSLPPMTTGALLRHMVPCCRQS